MNLNDEPISTQFSFMISISFESRTGTHERPSLNAIVPSVAASVIAVLLFMT